MRFIEVLKAVRNKFIRRKDKMQPEANQKKPEVQEVPEVPKKAEPEHDRLVRRYRAFAYHHRKSRYPEKVHEKADRDIPDRQIPVLREAVRDFRTRHARECMPYWSRLLNQDRFHAWFRR